MLVISGTMMTVRLVNGVFRQLLPAILLATLLAPALAIGEDMNESVLLLDFEDETNRKWEIVNDGVMGGRSKGFVEIQSGRLRFHGELVTQGGGFTSVRTSRSLDLSSYDGLEMRVRGNGRRFEVEVNDDHRYGWRSVSRRAPFETSDEWQTVRVPFSALRATVFGRSVDVPTVKLAEIQRIGFYILDGKDGPFELEVDSIRVYRSG
ncbi:MAG: CIA30 family protein [Xanthomonadales bacterium]|nr:CIA30 family protein [Xanthomonadales bacterium]